MKKIITLFRFDGIKIFWSVLSLRDKKIIFTLFFFMIAVSLLEVLSIGVLIPLINFIFDPQLNQKIVELFNYDILKNFDLAAINTILFLIFVMYFIKFLFLLFYSYYNSSALLKISLNLKNSLFKKYIDKDYVFHLNNNSSLLIRNVQNEVDVLMNSYLAPLLSFILSITNTLFIFVFLLIYSFKSSMIVISIFTVIGLALGFSVKKRLKTIGINRRLYSLNILKNLRESFTLIKEIKLMAKEKFFLDKLNLNNLNLARLGIQRGVMGALPRITFEFLFVVIVISSIFYVNSINLKIENFLTVLAIYAIAAFRIMPLLNGLSISYQKIKFGSPVVNMLRILNEKDFNENYFKKDLVEPLTFEKKIVFRDISFSYPLTEKKILKNLNFQINKGDIVGIVGDNASGKSTLVNIICGLLKPTTGYFSVDDNKITNVKNYQNKIGYIPQQINLVDGDVKSNISLGLDERDIDFERLNKSMSIVNLSSSLRINDLIYENGKNISGGQKQKIAIARALYNEPEILILDEPTSAMDLNSEKEFIEMVCNLQTTKTVVIVSHRVQALDNCNVIFKLLNGEISKL